MPETYEQLIKDMTACPQTKDLSVMEHGLMVNRYFDDLISGEPYHYSWRIPDWFNEHYDFIVSKLLHADILKQYQIHHDCGKPYCRTIDDEGKNHFPDHANVSYEVWKKLYPDDHIVANLIKGDMDIHCLKSEQLNEFAKRPEAISLLITGLAEIHANASMFGGVESTSFKIKWKQIDKRGRQIIDLIQRG